MNTNPGTFYVARGFHTKKLLYYSESFPDMLRFIYRTQLQRGTYKPVCDVNGKTEVLQIDKTGRTVYCVDAVTLIFQQMFFGQQVQSYSRSNLDRLWAWIGKTAYGTGALEAFAFVTDGGKRTTAYDFDVKKMEASIRTDDLLWLAQVHYDALCKDDQTPEAWQCIRTLYLGLAECPFIMPDLTGKAHAFWKGGDGQGGEPSGHLLTALDNSLVTLYLVATGYAWESLKRKERPSVERFWRWFRGMIMGDDLRLTLSNAATEWWAANEEGLSVGEAFAAAVFDATATIMESVDFRGVNIMDSVFCGWRFYLMTDPVYWITFKTDSARAVDAIKQGGDHSRTPEAAIINLGRINNMRLSTWADAQVRHKVTGFRLEYIRLCEAGWPQLLQNPEWAAVKGSVHSDHVLRQLYTGLLIPTPIGNQSIGFDTPDLEF